MAVVLGQTAWHLGLRCVTSTEISVAEAAPPILGIIFALLILGQIPSHAEMIGGSVVVVGIAFAVRGALVRGKEDKLQISVEKPGPFTGV